MRLFATILFLSIWTSMAVSFLTPTANGNPIELSEKNWQLMLEGEWMVQFVAPWCTSCKNLAPIWIRYAKAALKHDIKVAFVDITKSPALSGRFLVTSLPAIYHVIDGQFRCYFGKRDNDALINYIKNKEWQKIEPVSAWTNPNSWHMGALSYFFRLSFMLKEWNALLQDEYGLSAYGSYGLFVLGTILIGGILGLVLVVMLDFISTSKNSKKRRQFKEIKKQQKNFNSNDDELMKNNDQFLLVNKNDDDDDIEELVEEEEDENEHILKMNAKNNKNNNNDDDCSDVDVDDDDDDEDDDDDDDEENSSEIEKKDEDKDERDIYIVKDDHNKNTDYADNENNDEDNESFIDNADDVDHSHCAEGDYNLNTDSSNATFVMSKNIELMPDMYEDESDEDIYHNCKLIMPVPSSEGPNGFRKPLNATT